MSLTYCNTLIKKRRVDWVRKFVSNARVTCTGTCGGSLRKSGHKRSFPEFMSPSVLASSFPSINYCFRVKLNLTEERVRRKLFLRNQLAPRYYFLATCKTVHGYYCFKPSAVSNANIDSHLPI